MTFELLSKLLIFSNVTFYERMKPTPFHIINIIQLNIIDSKLGDQYIHNKGTPLTYGIYVWKIKFYISC